MFPPVRDPVPPHVDVGVVRVLPEDMAVVASADVTGEALDEALRADGLWLPIDVPPTLTLREAIDHDATGPLRLAHGGFRDRTTGAQFIDGHGRRVTAGGLPVKNVAGYDLVKLLVGGHGCFGRTETVTLRVARRPEAALVRSAAGFTGSLSAAVNALVAADAPPHWLLFDGGTRGKLRMGWLGSALEVSLLRGHVGPDVEQRTFADDAAERLGRLPLPVTACVAPMDVSGFAADLRADGVAHPYIDPALGVARLAGDAWDVARAAAARRGGHTTLVRDDGTVTCDGVPTATASMLRRLKEAFDPDGVLPPLPEGVR